MSAGRKFVFDTFPYLQYAMVSSSVTKRKRMVDGRPIYPTIHHSECDLPIEEITRLKALARIRHLSPSPEWENSMTELVHLMTSEGRGDSSLSIWVPTEELGLFIATAQTVSQIELAFRYQSTVMVTPWMRLDHVIDLITNSVPMEWNDGFAPSKMPMMTIGEAASGGLTTQRLFMCYTLMEMEAVCSTVVAWHPTGEIGSVTRLHSILSLVSTNSEISDHELSSIASIASVDNTFDLVKTGMDELIAIDSSNPELGLLSRWPGKRLSSFLVPD